MNKKMVIITSEKLKDIFSITGIEQYSVSNTINAEEIIREKIKDETIGLILIEEGIYKNLSEKVRFFIENKWEGVITKLPSLEQEERETGYILGKIKRVLGYQIKIT